MQSADLRRLLLTRIIPIGFGLGAGMEAFMYVTGFWGVATKKEAERRKEKQEEIARLAKAGMPMPSALMAAGNRTAAAEAKGEGATLR